MLRTILLLLACTLATAPIAAAQQLRLSSEVEHPAVEAMRSILETGDYRLIDRDTLIPAEATIGGDLVIIGSTVRLEGTVKGRVAVLNGTLFVRPGSRIDGEIVSIGGMILGSALATTGATVTIPLEVEVMVRREGGGDYALTLDPPPPLPRLKTAGIFGITPPTYDRVNALTVRGGGSLRLGADSLAPVLHVNAAIRTARWSPGGTVSLVAPLGRAALLTLAGGRETRTNDRWIRGDLENSAAALFVRSDARDYYDSDFLSVTLADRAAPPLIPGDRYFTPSLQLRVEDDRSLTARDAFTLFGSDPWRENPAIDEGRIASVTPAAEVGWAGVSASAKLTAGVELGRVQDAGSWRDGDDFAQLVADGEWRMATLWRHTIQIHGHYLQPLGATTPPRQRWSSIGGSGTLPTLEYDARRGDHLVFVESAYNIPLPRLAVPILGVPSFGLRHAVGSAWRSEWASPRWAQNLGAGIEFSYLYLFLYLDPAEGHRTVLSYGVSLP